MKIQTTELYSEIDTEVKKGTRYIFLRGSSRSGKTISGLQYLIVEALVNPNTIITIARETQVSIKNTILIDFKTILEGMGLWVDGKFNKVEMLFRFDNGSTVRFIGLDDTTGKLRGMKSDIIFVDEVNTVQMSSFVQLDIRCEKYILAAYNPEVETDWWGFDYENKENGVMIHSTWKQNPFLDDRIRESIESLKDTDPDLYKIYSEGLLVPPREIIFQTPETFSELPSDIKYTYYGIDFGFSNDVTAVTKVSVRGNELYVEEVIYQAGLTNQDLIFLLKDKGINRDHDIVCDSSEPKSIEELRRGGLSVRGVKKGGGSILYGIQKMRTYKIFVKEDSLNILNEFGQYRYKKDRSGRVTQQVTGDDHSLDSIRYVVMEFLDNLFQKGQYVVV